MEVEKKTESFQKQENKFFILLHPDHNPINHDHYDWENHKYSELDDALKKLLKDLLVEKKEDLCLKDFERSVSYHCDEDYRYTVMKKRFIRALKKQIYKIGIQYFTISEKPIHSRDRNSCPLSTFLRLEGHFVYTR